MTTKDKIDFQNAKCCQICKEELTEKRVRDHDHETGKYRGAAHPKCNINYYSSRFLPVVAHNLRGYDSHLIIKKAYQINEKLGNKPISVIPNSFEKFMSFSVGGLKFIDSLQFMASSLGTLVENLYDKNDKYINFNFMKKEYPEHYELLCKKGHYPYEWVNGIDKLDHIGLPPIESFYSQLKQKGLKPKEYEHAQHVYETLNCQSFRDYHTAYLHSDVLLLADVFEQFRKPCYNYYELDPANYLTAPSLAWDAMLLKTGVELELITDLKILDIIERQKRGGLCFVGSKRHVKANNKYIEGFDISQPSSYLMYWDANNLYGWAMSQSLPFKDLKFDKEVTLDQILETSDEAETGYIVEVDISYPIELHDKFKEFPPCPESITPKQEWFSDFQKEIGIKTGMIKKDKYRGSDKLVPHLYTHKNYVMHYRNLKFVQELGVRIDVVHQVLSFKQEPWLKSYIDFNTEKRKEAKNEFEKDFFKLMNNSVFGKTMENVKNRMELKLTTDRKYAIRWFSKLHFKDSKCHDGLHMIEMFKKAIEYNKPIYAGTSILDLSKLCMMKFHYNVIHKNFEGRYNLIYSDTDSLVYLIQHEDIYTWIKDNKDHFDLASSKRPELKDPKNDKALGKFKDELHGLVMKEFTALNPKVYSIITQHIKDKKETMDVYNPLTNKLGFEVKHNEIYHENYNKKTLKGVSKVVVKRDIAHKDYNDVLETNESAKRFVMSIRSFNHQLYTLRTEKVALTSFYDKLQLIDSINCVPYGYKHNQI